MYPDRFSGISKFSGEFHVTIKEDAELEVHATHKYPIHLKQDIENDLEKMESMDVITKVTDLTDWVSLLVFSRKSNGQLRIGLDHKDLNKAVNRMYGCQSFRHSAILDTVPFRHRRDTSTQKHSKK